jgi:hypothetical protein
MSNKLGALTEVQVNEIDRRRRAGESWAVLTEEAKRWLGCDLSHDTLRQFMVDRVALLASHESELRNPQRTGKQPTAEVLSTTQRLEDEVRRAHAAERSAIKRAVEAERLREIFNAARSIEPVIPDWTREASTASDVPHIPVLVSSDWHFGEVIEPDNMDGLNEYNLEIAEARYRRLIQKTIELSFDHLPKNRYDGLILLRLGDTVAGDIHEELSKTNDLPTLPVCRRVAAMESWGLGQLADAFGAVYVISVPGNHGRTTKKPESKLVANQSYDQLISWWLEDRMSADPRITFYTPPSGDAVFSIHDRSYLATHGDRIGSRGGTGFVGPLATVLRGMKKVMDTQAAVHQPVDKIFIGHFHTLADVGYGWVNGSMPGYSEYGRDGRFRPEPAAQYLINFHPKYGSTSQWPIYLRTGR